MKILALDLGTTTGWAFHDGVISTHGSKLLASEKNLRHARNLRMDRRLDPRAIALWTFLSLSLGRGKPDYILFEDIQFGKSLAQVQLWSSFRGVVWGFAVEEGIEVDCLATGKLKKFATGSGAADKTDMAKALTRDPRYILHPKGVRDLNTGDILGDDAVDAIHLLKWALATFPGAYTTPKAGTLPL